MSDSAFVGLAVLCVMASPFLLLIRPLLDYRRLGREWAALQAEVAAARADFEPLLDRIARDELAGFFEAWNAGVSR